MSQLKCTIFSTLKDTRTSMAFKITTDNHNGTT